MKLPTEFKTKWIAALRSGHYKQGEALLYDNTEDTYCCLGVAEIVCGNDKEAMYLANLNDQGESFERIAAIIEQ